MLFGLGRFFSSQWTKHSLEAHLSSGVCLFLHTAALVSTVPPTRAASALLSKQISPFTNLLSGLTCSPTGRGMLHPGTEPCPTGRLGKASGGAGSYLLFSFPNRLALICCPLLRVRLLTLETGILLCEESRR